MRHSEPAPSPLIQWVAACLLTAAPLAAQPALVLEGGTVHSLAGEAMVGRVIVADGLIQAVGPEVASPAGATRIDISGLHVYPGIFDALSTIGLVEVSAVAATVDSTEIGAYNPHLMATTAIHPASEVIPVTRANGITHTVAAPNSGGDGVIAGQAALIHLDGWTIEEMAIEPSVAMVIRWPEIRTRIFDPLTFSRRTVPFTEAEEAAEETLAGLLDWLDAARHYRQAAKSERTEINLELAALAKILDRGQKVILIVDSARGIKAAIDFAEKQGLDAILAGGREAWKVKKLLAEKDVPVLLGRTQSLPTNDDDPYDRTFRSAAELAAAGVRFAFASGAGGSGGPPGPHFARRLPYESATAAAFGLPREEAFKAITRYPAEIFGVGDKLGTVEAGKIANLIVTDGDPLEITTQIRHVIVAGRVSSSANHHLALYERYRARPEGTR